MSSSSSQKSTILLFGSSGRVGFSLLSTLLSAPYSSHFDVTILLRPSSIHSADQQKSALLQKIRAESSVKIIEAELDSETTIEKMVEWMKGIDIVVSVLAGTPAAQVFEGKLFEAAKVAKVSWFIPSLFFAFDFFEAPLDSMPFLQMKRQYVQSIRNSGLKSIFIINGVFTELLFGPLNGVDLNNATITAPYSFEAKLTTTTKEDVGKLTAELLLKREDDSVKNQLVYLSGDSVSYSQLHALLEEHFKKPFQKVLVTKEEALETVKADTTMRNLPARLRIIFGEQKGVNWEQSWNSKHAPHIAVSTVKQFIHTLK